MKKRLGLLIAFGAVSALTASAVVIDEWDMSDDGANQVSDGGVILPFTNTNGMSYAQTAGDSTFLFSPTNASGYSARVALSSTADLTAGIAILTLSAANFDWSTNSAANSKVSIRLWNSAQTEWVGLGWGDQSDKVKAQVTSSSGLGGVNNTIGRVVNGLAGAPSSDIVMEIDYQNGELRTYAPGGWNWAPGGADEVYTNAVDFAGNGITDLGRIQVTYANMTEGDLLTYDDVKVEAVPEPATLGMIGLVAGGLLFIRRRFMI
jgi:hypothetical protein